MGSPQSKGAENPDEVDEIPPEARVAYTKQQRDEALYTNEKPLQEERHVEVHTPIFQLADGKTLHYDATKKHQGGRGYYVKSHLKTLVAPIRCALCDDAPSSVFCVQCDMNLCDINDCNHGIHKPMAMNGHTRVPIERDVTTALQYIRPTTEKYQADDKLYFVLGRKVLVEKAARDARERRQREKEEREAAIKADAEEKERERRKAEGLDDDDEKKKEIKMELSSSEEESSEEGDSDDEEDSDEEEEDSDEEEEDSDAEAEEDSDEDDDDDEDEDEDEDDGELKCCICKKTEMDTPWRSACEHVACKQCWMDHLDDDDECPKCEEVVDLEDLKPIHVCVVCESVAEQPWTAHCGHTCCNECWRGVLEEDPACPECGEAVDAFDLPAAEEDDSDDDDDEDSDDDDSD